MLRSLNICGKIEKKLKINKKRFKVWFQFQKPISLEYKTVWWENCQGNGIIQGWTQKVWRREWGGGIDCRRHVSSGVSRERGRVWEGFSSYKGVRGSGGLPGKFLKLDCLRVHFHAIFKSFSLILQADFFFSDNFGKSRVRKLLGQHSFVGSCSPSHLIQEGQLSVSSKRVCTG